MSRESNRVLLIDRPHRRYNALTGDWVFVSPQRVRRPWEGRQEAVSSAATAPSYDPNCALCPGNIRAHGDRNPDYTSTHVWTNDFPAFVPDNPSIDVSLDPLMRARTQGGTCRVICYSPHHNLSMSQMPATQIRSIIDTWANELTELERSWRWVQVFENRGEMMGCSNPHPHGQIWASDFIPQEVSRELTQQREWYKARGVPLLLDYADREYTSGERLIAHNAHWLVVVPWWAAWPFETLLLPRRAVSRIPDLSEFERDALADILSVLLAAYDRLFNTPFPYSFGWHGDQLDSCEGHSIGEQTAQLHAHFYPPLLRSPTIRKFMVGYELLACLQRDISPEHVAERLRQHLEIFSGAPAQ